MTNHRRMVGKGTTRTAVDDQLVARIIRARRFLCVGEDVRVDKAA